MINSYAPKIPENKVPSNTPTALGASASDPSAGHFIDNRPEAARMSQLQAVANNSPQVRQLKEIQDLADNHTSQANGYHHADRIAESFGAFYPQNIRADHSPKAVQLNHSQQTGAMAYGANVNFASEQPGVLQAAHEAAHVVQQGMGWAHAANGNEMETQAREAASLVHQGKSAEGIFQDSYRERGHGQPRAVGQADTGLLRPAGAIGPDGGPVEYVKIDVLGDGSCLFYASFLSSVASTMLERLKGHAFQDSTPDQIKLAVETEAIQILHTDRDHLRASLDAFQAQARQDVARYWRANPVTFNDDIARDIKSLAISYLSAQRLTAGIYGQAQLPVVSGVSSKVDRKDSLESKRSTESKKSAESKKGVEPMMIDTGPKKDVSGGDKLKPEDLHVKAQQEALNAYLAGQKKAAAKENKPMDASAELAVPQFDLNKLGLLMHTGKQEGFGLMAHFPKVGDPVIKRISDNPLGQKVRTGSALDKKLRELILQKLKLKLDAAPHANPSFDGSEFSLPDLTPLINDYITEFESSKVWAGQAALNAYKATSALNIQTHIYQDNTQRIQGDDSPETPVKIIETPGHFQVLVGPFPQGHLLPNNAIRPIVPVTNLDPDEGSILKEDLLDEHTVKVGPNGLGVETIGMGLRKDGTPQVWVGGKMGKQNISIWLGRRVNAAHYYSAQLRPILEYVLQIKDGKNHAVYLNHLSERFQALKAPEGGKGSHIDLGLKLKDADGLIFLNNIVYTSSLIPLRKHLEAMMAGPLSRGKTHHGAAMVKFYSDMIARNEKTMAAIVTTGKSPVLLAIGLHTIKGCLSEIVKALKIDSLHAGSVLHVMPRLNFPFRVFYPPDSEAVPKAEFDAEVFRQVAIQQKYLNRMTLDQWMFNRDLFNVKVPARTEGILGNRSVSHLRSLQDELQLRNAKIGDKMGTKGNLVAKKQRLGNVNNMMMSTIHAASATDYLIKRQKEIHTIGKGRTYDSKEKLNEQEILALLKTLLSTMYDTGKMDEDGGTISAMIVRDLVGRSNEQSKWRQVKQADLEKVAASMVKKWQGLYPMDNADPLKGLAILHNPDQVAGGERNIPEDLDHLSDALGPSVVNSALGRSWGLQETDSIQPNAATQLEQQILQLFPEASWPLYQMNVVLEVEIIKGSHVIPRDDGKKR